MPEDEVEFEVTGELAPDDGEEVEDDVDDSPRDDEVEG